MTAIEAFFGIPDVTIEGVDDFEAATELCHKRGWSPSLTVPTDMTGGKPGVARLSRDRAKLPCI